MTITGSEFEFEYRPQEGVHIIWGITVTGIEGIGIDGELESQDSLVEVEGVIEDLEADYGDESGAALARVRGAHGWREFEWDDGSVHRYEWSHAELDMRCSRCRSADNDLYMVTDELWRSSGLDGRVCFRCFEKAIGRPLTSEDFKQGLPANDGNYHGPELRARMGYT